MTAAVTSGPRLAAEGQKHTGGPRAITVAQHSTRRGTLFRLLHSCRLLLPWVISCGGVFKGLGLRLHLGVAKLQDEAKAQEELEAVLQEVRSHHHRSSAHLYTYVQSA